VIIEVSFPFNRKCVAVTDREMDEIWRVVPDGTRIELKP
jgi:hypothetical protein